MRTEDQEKLRSYAIEIGLPNEAITVEDLIASHRRMRDNMLKLEADKRAAWEKARATGFEMGLAQASQATVKVSALRAMTLGEVVALLEGT